MKTVLIVILAVLSITPAYADRGWGRGGGWGGGWIAPALIGGAIAYDLAYPYRYPYSYPYPVYAQPAPVQVQPQYQAQAQPSAPSWYYCASAKGYYPYVPNCPEGWKSVPSQPPQAGPR